MRDKPVKTLSGSEPSPVSNDFIAAFTGGAGVVVECEFCNRTLFGNGSEGMEPGEYEKLVEQAREDPKRYIEIGGDWAVTHGDLANRSFVPDCPCNGGRPFEDFIWNYREQIARYLVARSRRELEQTKKNMQTAEQARSANEKI